MKILLDFIWQISKLILLAWLCAHCISKGGWYFVIAAITAIVMYWVASDINKLLGTE